MARYRPSYADLAEIIRHRFTQAEQAARTVRAAGLNILCGNTDDQHATTQPSGRQHLTLTPAYMSAQNGRNEASQAMLDYREEPDEPPLRTAFAAAPDCLLERGRREDLDRDESDGCRRVGPEVAAEPS